MDDTRHDDRLAATRRSYDTVAGAYGDLLADHPDHTLLEWSLLDLFARRVGAAGGGPVVEVGCGTGRVTAHLADEQGLTDVRGIDLSPGMVAEARRRHPHLDVEVGTFTDLDAADATLAGVLSWYSIIHTPPVELPGVFAELHRVLRPGGTLLVGFKIGDGVTHLREAYGDDALDLEVFRLPVAWLADRLGDAGLHVDTRVVREPVGPETSPQGFLFATRPVAEGRAPHGVGLVRSGGGFDADEEVVEQAGGRLGGRGRPLGPHHQSAGGVDEGARVRGAGRGR